MVRRLRSELARRLDRLATLKAALGGPRDYGSTGGASGAKFVDGLRQIIAPEGSTASSTLAATCCGGVFLFA
jgi:hypothetical protein